MAEQKTWLRLECAPAWQLIDDVRRFAATICSHASLGAEQSDAVAMATHELLQNAVQHSSDGRLALLLEFDAPARKFRVAVENTSTPEQIARLTEIRARLEAEPDAKKHYLGLMQRTVGQTQSGLGLGRIRFEGGMDVKIESDGEMVRVTASCGID